MLADFSVEKLLEGFARGIRLLFDNFDIEPSYVLSTPVVLDALGDEIVLI